MGESRRISGRAGVASTRNCWLGIAVTNALFAPRHGLRVGPVSLDHARVALASSALVTCATGRTAAGAGGFRLQSAAALRSGFVPLRALLRLRSTVSARRPQTEAYEATVALTQASREL